MTLGAILAQLSAQGIRLQRDGGNLVVTPREALTDELRELIRDHKPELLQAISNPPEALALHAGNLACDGCQHIGMVQEPRPSDSRRFFWFKCGRGHSMIETAYHGERVLLAPASCADFEPKARH